MHAGGAAEAGGTARGRGAGALLVGLLLGTAATALAAALLAPPAYELVEALAPGRFPFQRVFRRLAMLLALGALLVGLRRAGVRRLADIGLGRRPGAARAALLGAGTGALVVAGVFLAELALGHRAPSLAALRPALVAQALGSGAAVGLLEEGVCRGALLFPFGPLGGGGLAAANLATSALYSTAHFLRGGGRVHAVDAWSGFRLWAELPGALWDHAEAWVGLFLTGALLYLLAARQGHAWGAAGVHAGAVGALQLLGAATEPVAGRDALFLVDGLLPGWGFSALLALGLLGLAGRRRARPAER
jgi:hypothetical protein